MRSDIYYNVISSVIIEKIKKFLLFIGMADKKETESKILLTQPLCLGYVQPGVIQLLPDVLLNHSSACRNHSIVMFS